MTETVELVGGPRDGERFTTPEVMGRIETVDPTPVTTYVPDDPALPNYPHFNMRTYRLAGMRDDGTWWYTCHHGH